MQLAALLTHALRSSGVKELFGIPGDFILPLLEQLQQQPDALPFYYLTHEPAAVYAADAAARAANRPAAIALTYGAGALNGVNAVAQAYEEYVPLIVIAGFPSAKELQSGLQIHHQAKTLDSQRHIFAEVTACQVRLDNPETAAAELYKALSVCQQQSRPVLIEIARDAVEFDLKITPNLSTFQCPKVDEKAYQQLVRALTQAHRPVLLSGVNVRRSGAQQALERLAEQFNIPVVTTLLGRASIDPAHGCYAGVFCGSKTTQAYKLLAEADLIIAMGVVYTDSNFSAHQDLIHAPHFYRINFPQQPLKNWCTRLASEPFPLFEARPIAAPERVTKKGFDGEQVVREIHQQLSLQKAIVPLISDIGDCLFASLQASPSQLLAPAYYASMGYSVPAALGVYAVSKRRPVVLVGDGAFLMTGLELGHCIRYGCHPIVILFNNHKWDMIEAFAPNLHCTQLQQWQYQHIATAMSVESTRVCNHESFSRAFAKAWADPDHAHLIDVWLPENSRTEQLSQFAKSLTKINKPDQAEV